MIVTIYDNTLWIDHSLLNWHVQATFLSHLWSYCPFVFSDVVGLNRVKNNVILWKTAEDCYCLIVFAQDSGVVASRDLQWCFLNPSFFLVIVKFNLLHILFSCVTTENKNTSRGCNCCKVDSFLFHWFYHLPSWCTPVESLCCVCGIIWNTKSSNGIKMTIIAKTASHVKLGLQ